MTSADKPTEPDTHVDLYETRDDLYWALWSALEVPLTEGPTYDLNDPGQNDAFAERIAEIRRDVLKDFPGLLAVSGKPLDPTPAEAWELGFRAGMRRERDLWFNPREPYPPKNPYLTCVDEQ